MNLFSNEFKFLAAEETFSYGGLKLTPIVAPTSNPENVRGFDELFDQEQAIASEIGYSGIVTEINLENRSSSYLLLIDGEAIIGAKQNRIAQKSLIIRPHFTQTIPVNCVEQGRWRYDGDTAFSKSSFSAGPRMRDAKISMLKINKAADVQHVVWDEVQEVSGRINSGSSTSDLGEILSKNPHLREQEYRDFINNQTCNGYLVEGTGKPYFEVFCNSIICKSYMNKMLRSLLSDCKYKYTTKIITDEKKLYVNPLLQHYADQLKNAKWEADNQVGAEDAFISLGDDNGRAISLNGEFVHGYVAMREPKNV